MSAIHLVLLKCDPKIYQNLFQDIPDFLNDQKTVQRKKPKAITVLKKEVGGVRQGMIMITDSMFFLWLPLSRLVCLEASRHKTQIPEEKTMGFIALS